MRRSRLPVPAVSGSSSHRRQRRQRRRGQDLASRYADVHCSVGVHPLDLAPGEAPALDWLLGELDHPALPPSARPASTTTTSPRPPSCNSRPSACTSKPPASPASRWSCTREARADTLALLREAALPQAGVLHCFTEDWEMAKAALDIGFYISLSGIVTFRNAEALREVARQVPADRLLVETDSPYLAPFRIEASPTCPSTCGRSPSSSHSCVGWSSSTSPSRPPTTSGACSPGAPGGLKLAGKNPGSGDESGSRPLE